MIFPFGLRQLLPAVRAEIVAVLMRRPVKEDMHVVARCFPVSVLVRLPHAEFRISGWTTGFIRLAHFAPHFLFMRYSITTVLPRL